MRKYKVTPRKFSFGNSFQVEVWDEHGNYVEVYENTRISASNFILNWWENSDKRKKQKELEKKTIQKLIKLDKQGKILKGNRDGLD